MLRRIYLLATRNYWFFVAKHMALSQNDRKELPIILKRLRAMSGMQALIGTL